MSNNHLIRNTIIIVCFLVFSIFSLFSAEIDWHPLDFKLASQKAKREKKLIHIVVEGDNCPPCEAYKSSHLQDPAYIDFVNTLFINIKAHDGTAEGRKFLSSLNLTQPVIPRFYVLDGEGRGISMFIGLIEAPPMEGGSVLQNAAGLHLPIDKSKALSLAQRLRSYRASFEGSGGLDASNPFRSIGLAVLEAQAWALGGNLLEAEVAFGSSWVSNLNPPDVMAWYINFWLSWNHNLPSALIAAENYYQLLSYNPLAGILLARAYAQNNRLSEAIILGERLLESRPGDRTLERLLSSWRSKSR